MIDLFKGHPSPRLLPHESLAESLRKVLNHPLLSKNSLEYAADEGDVFCRTRIVEWLREVYLRTEGDLDLTKIDTFAH